ncbi:30S ribosomal protein S20 [Staphylococcus epidermidis]|uniref:30S ribosomal protein S20 n=1 Tax=Staphylococcus epidermidis TaxID=1282 RepID=UPI00119F2C49|nr:30S ribosomal protein S20 [Staphylococcus epidermidis]
MPNIKSPIKPLTTTQTAQQTNISNKNPIPTPLKPPKTPISTHPQNKHQLLTFPIKQLHKPSQTNLIHSNKPHPIKSKLISPNK